MSKSCEFLEGGSHVDIPEVVVSYLVRNMAAQRLVRGDATLDPFMRIVPSLEVRGL
jgi:hypothetical protein